MKKYETPKLTLFALSVDDVIRTSGRDPIETEEDIFGFALAPSYQEQNVMAFIFNI